MKSKPKVRRKGNVVVLVAVLLPVLLGMGAFAIDIGYIVFMRSQAQAGADAGALAAVEELPGNQATLDSVASRYASLNIPSCSNLQVTAEAGTWDADPATFTLASLAHANAVRVTVLRTNAGLFFGHFLGKAYADISASATAAYDYRVAGFEVTESTPYRCSLLPFVVHVDDWNDKILGKNTTDLWTYDEDSKAVSVGGDGTPEINMYPDKVKDKDNDNAGAGNFGTVDIGHLNNATPDIDRQIRYGPNAEDLAPFGGKLELDKVTGTLELNGDTGISAALKDPLTDIIGQPRTIMLYDQVTGTGNNTYFRIVAFVGITIVEVSLTGNPKYCTIQPTCVTDATAVTGSHGESYYVRYPPRIVQ